MISVRHFSGALPRREPSLLENNEAQIAGQCKLLSGGLDSWITRRKVDDLAKTSFINSIFKYGNNWLHWTEDVDVARGPIAGDTTDRIYFTGTDKPRATDNTMVDVTTGNTGTITGASKANPAVITSVAHALFTGARVAIDNIVGMTELNGTTYTVTVIDADNFSLDGIDSTAYTTYVSGGDWTRVQEEYPEDSVWLGVPAPVTAPTVTPVVITGAITGATQANPVVITSAAHGRTTGDLVEINNVVGMTELNGNTYTITVLTASTFSLDGIDGTGYTAYTSGGDWDLVYAPADIKKEAYVYTFVNSWGEEGPPSPVSTITDVGPDQVVNLTNMDGEPAGDYQNITLWRIYRVNTGSAAADYQLVVELTINTSSPQYADSVADADLGEVIASTDWDPPPADMAGIISLPNGVMAGFSGNELCLSEPYRPHAWPSGYRLTVENQIVAIGFFGVSVVVATNAEPYVASGIHPSSMTLRKYPEPRACVSKRGIANLKNGVVFPCADGLMYIGTGRSLIVTREIMTRDEWQELNPDTLHAVYYNDRYYGFYENGLVNGVMTGAGFIFDIEELNARYTTLDYFVHATYADPLTGLLYFCEDNAGSNEIHQWEGGAIRDDYNWKSKTFSLPEPVNLGAARIIGDYNLALTDEQLAIYNADRALIIAENAAILGQSRGEMNGYAINTFELNGSDIVLAPAVYTSPEGVTFTLYVDNEVKMSKQVMNNRPFRLPKGYKGTEIEFRLTGQVYISRADLAPSIEDLP